VTNFYIEFTAHAVGQTPEQFDVTLDDIAERLLECHGAIDADLAGDSAKQDITFCLTVDASSLDDAAAKVFAIARTALHASGGSTPGWESIGYAIPSQDDDKQLMTA